MRLLAVIAETTDSTSFEVAPSPFLLIFMLLSLVALGAAVVTALKGRWGWFWFGFVTIGLFWLYSAFLPPRPGSLWERRSLRRAAR